MPHTPIGRSALVAAFALLVQCQFQCLNAQHGSPRPHTSEQVFFSFDDHSIPWMENLKLKLERPQKHGRPVLQPGPDGSVDDWGAILYGTVLFDGGRFRMWYLAWPRPDRRFPLKPGHQYRPIAYAESRDGIRWTKPNLGLVDFRGSKENNLVLIEPQAEPYSRSNDFISVLLDPQDPDVNRRYKMAYIVYDAERRFSTTATAVSPDGLKWRLVNTEPFTGGHFENTGLIRFQGMYYASGQNVPPYGGHLHDGTAAGRQMTELFSPDFEHWSAGKVLCFWRTSYGAASASDQPKRFPSHLDQLHMGAGLWNRGNVVLGLYGRWYGDTVLDRAKGLSLEGLKMDLGFVMSNDGVHYREPVPDFVMIPHGGPADWDSEAILQAQAFHNTETHTYIWYSHWDTGVWPIPPRPEPAPTIKPQAVGLATMRLDGFGYLGKLNIGMPEETQGKSAAGGRKASFVTRLIRLQEPATLWINVSNVSATSPLQLELIDDRGFRLAGYAPVAVKEEAVQGPVEWQDKKLPARVPFRIRATWPEKGDPRFYALYLRD